MAGKKNPNLGDKLRQEREGAENTLRDSRNKAADSSTGDSSKKKAEHRRQIRHEADLAKMRSKKLKSEQEVKAKKNAAASGKKGGKPKKPGNLAADALSAKAHQSVRNADQDNNSGVEAAHFNPLLHALEGAVPLPEQEPVFTVYDDIRQKLIAQGMPADQIAFIHEANTEVRKKELFSKVRTGQVRVLLGSTAKMGAGTNVQDRLVALHDLDCPWRPGDLAQRKGRIERQGNQNPLVHVYRYVTEGTFDAYLWVRHEVA